MRAAWLYNCILSFLELASDILPLVTNTAKTPVSGGSIPVLRVRGGAFDSAKNHKRQRRKRQSVTAKREKSQTPKFV